MKEIKLTQGKFALVDNEDFDYLNQWKWHLHSLGYAATCIRIKGTKKQKHLLMHRLISNPTKDFEVDHINRNKLDNRRKNLRNVTHSINLRNQSLKKHNSSGYLGISWDKSRNRWRAIITINKKIIYLGRYSNIQAAWLARRWGERAYFSV